MLDLAMLKKTPFNLNDKQVSWVTDTLESMSQEEKIGQIFCPICGETEPEKINQFVNTYNPGGVLYRPMESKVIKGCHKAFQDSSRIPMLLAANLESGGVGIASDGTYFSRPMGVAATGNKENAYRLGYISGKEAAAVGCNWSFAPICDLDKNFMNPIMNVRTFGDNVNTVIGFVKEQLRGLDEFGVAAAPKHFPGDGVDFRDQHLVSSVNSLSVEEYDESYGKIWREVIDTGVLSVMVGHILQPAYSKLLNPSLKDEDIMPATLATEILQGLLRDKLGFNGVIVTDATPMIGFTTAMKRSDALPACIMAGCDMILFNKNIDEDYEFIRAALSDGRLSEERLEEAAIRILAMKAAMGLPEKKAKGTLVPEEAYLTDIDCKEHRDWTKQCADEAVTLVKDTQHLLPISPDKYKKIRLYFLEDRVGGGFKDGESEIYRIKALLEKEGFEVSVYDYAKPDFYEMFETGVGYAKEKFDLAIYVACIDTASNQSVRRIDWVHLMAADAPWFVNDIPTMFISLANPYHLVDAPMVKTFINAYTPTKEVCEAVVEKIMGRSQFKGISPVDPFCGVWGSKF
ncbi:beta-N-acetylhexosaminidase [Pseudobutyrivibrio sp. ACV-2]|uniref:glycoside hydrolase family 3 protein n=1 Tax=Pseudobutyrivibrio sp. ACV-2 TaxID=1520801 RepID=UPI00089DA4BC|nr:glycoside hydrolase family 3 N-terminal domain-containing protein [Pseudobutyrivibrio sp. ACV-2]SEA27084.1 beta-N-acetylhexosaminidase [Pseudobutyrivibrio sp. ACV-2]